MFYLHKGVYSSGTLVTLYCCLSQGHSSPEAHAWTLKNILPLLVDVASSEDFLESVR